jgi:shikimate dehydrogenase
VGSRFLRKFFRFGLERARARTGTRTRLDLWYYLPMKIFPLALIGLPVKQSRSDVYHRFFISTLNLPATYEKVEVSAAELKAFIHHAKSHYHGLSVTMPLKERILPLLDYVDVSAQDIGAVNTVLFQEGKALGFNTDGKGALHALQHKFKVDGQHAVIVGTGGAGKAIAWELKRAGAKLTLVNRTPHSAIALAASLGANTAPIHQLETLLQADDCNILVQATSVGMQDNQCIISPEKIPAHVAVLDVLSAPQNQWLSTLSQKGNLTISGRLMWIFQAIEQYKIWFGGLKQKPSRDLLNILSQAMHEEAETVSSN